MAGTQLTLGGERVHELPTSLDTHWKISSVDIQSCSAVTFRQTSPSPVIVNQLLVPPTYAVKING